MHRVSRLAFTLLSGYALLALLPLALAWFQGLPPRPWQDELATALALTGFAMLLMEFLLSGRFKTLSARVGMDRVMQFHQVMAYVVVLFLLLHPFLYTLPMGVDHPGDPERTGWLSLPLAPGLTGTIAWILLALLVATAILRDALPFRYEFWRASHGIGAVLIALTGLHHTLEAGRYSSNDPLATLWLVAVAIAVLSLVHVHLVIPLRQRRRPYRLAALSRDAERTWTLELEPDTEAGHPGTPFPYRAGQFAWLRFHRPLFRITEHPFSISSAPAQWPRMAFTIKEVGDFTARIGSLPLGTRVYLDGPYGNFCLQRGDVRPLVLIGGGVGMAPVMSLLRDLRARGVSRRIRVIQGNRVEGQILYREELDAMCRTMPLEVHHVLSEPPPGWTGETGMPDAALLSSCIPAAERTGNVYYVCGPPAMIDAVEQTLLETFGVPPAQVICERFRYTLGGHHGGTGRLLAACLWTAAGIVVAAVGFALR